MTGMGLILGQRWIWMIGSAATWAEHKLLVPLITTDATVGLRYMNGKKHIRLQPSWLYHHYSSFLLYYSPWYNLISAIYTWVGSITLLICSCSQSLLADNLKSEQGLKKCWLIWATLCSGSWPCFCPGADAICQDAEPVDWKTLLSLLQLVP